MKIGLYPNINKKEAIEVLKHLFSINDNNIQFIINNKFKSKLNNSNFIFGDMLKVDFIITLGGDGTLIEAARKYSCYNIPLLGINLGHLGFLTEVNTNNINNALEKLKNQEYEMEERMMIKATVKKDDQRVKEINGLNDVVLTRKYLSRMISAQVKINDLLLDDYYADGVIVCTPTGSTGYSLSAGGPVLDPTTEMMVITPICPHSLHTRSIAVSKDKNISINPNFQYNNNTTITVDGQFTMDIKEGMKVVVSKSDITTKLIKLNFHNFYELLRKELFVRRSDKCDK